MKMHPAEVYIYEVSGPEAFAVSSMLTYSQEWPAILHYIGKSFKFQSNEVMKDWMIGEYGGHAKYVEIKAE